mmetsp:Transcript_1034/g.3297  ORF Transcript_1034/g.3297 Transcript_1034/m.3297 type:complete len:355 (-) Transcript_1034:368-1432(-)
MKLVLVSMNRISALSTLLSVSTPQLHGDSERRMCTLQPMNDSQLFFIASRTTSAKPSRCQSRLSSLDAALWPPRSSVPNSTMLGSAWIATFSSAPRASASHHDLRSVHGTSTSCACSSLTMRWWFQRWMKCQATSSAGAPSRRRCTSCHGMRAWRLGCGTRSRSCASLARTAATASASSPPDSSPSSSSGEPSSGASSTLLVGSSVSVSGPLSSPSPVGGSASLGDAAPGLGAAMASSGGISLGTMVRRLGDVASAMTASATPGTVGAMRSMLFVSSRARLASSIGMPAFARALLSMLAPAPPTAPMADTARLDMPRVSSIAFVGAGPAPPAAVAVASPSAPSATTSAPLMHGL